MISNAAVRNTVWIPEMNAVKTNTGLTSPKSLPGFIKNF